MPQDREGGDLDRRRAELIERVLAQVPAPVAPPDHSTWVDCADQSLDLAALYQAPT